MKSIWSDVKAWVKRGGIFDIFTYLIQYGLMAVIVFSVTLGGSYTIPFNVIVAIMGNITLPDNATVIDLIFYAGVPVLFVMAFVVIFMCVAYKWLWKKLKLLFGKCRSVHKEFLDKKSEEKSCDDK